VGSGEVQRIRVRSSRHGEVHWIRVCGSWGWGVPVDPETRWSGRRIRSPGTSRRSGGPREPRRSAGHRSPLPCSLRLALTTPAPARSTGPWPNSLSLEPAGPSDLPGACPGPELQRQPADVSVFAAVSASTGGADLVGHVTQAGSSARGWSRGQGGTKLSRAYRGTRCRWKWKTVCQAARPVAWTGLIPSGPSARRIIPATWTDAAIAFSASTRAMCHRSGE
jgi:hypothetical protein